MIIAAISLWLIVCHLVFFNNFYLRYEKKTIEALPLQALENVDVYRLPHDEYLIVEFVKSKASISAAVIITQCHYYNLIVNQLVGENILHIYIDPKN